MPIGGFYNLRRQFLKIFPPCRLFIYWSSFTLRHLKKNLHSLPSSPIPITNFRKKIPETCWIIVWKPSFPIFSKANLKTNFISQSNTFSDFAWANFILGQYFLGYDVSKKSFQNILNWISQIFFPERGDRNKASVYVDYEWPFWNVLT